jgi:inorganic triphosphatase YgiF
MDVYEQLEPLDEQCRYGLWLSELEKLRLGDLDSQQTLLAWAKSYKHIKSWDTLIPEINDIVFGVQMGQMLISLSEWVYLQPWRGDESSRLKKRSKRSLAAFLAHWFEEHWLDVEQNVRDIKQDEGGWQGPQQRIERLIRLTLYWQQFYKEKKVRRFLAPWHDLVAGADELNRLKWLAHKVDKLPQKEQGEVLDWLGNERGACVMAITQTLEGLNRLKPFWG